MSWPYASEEGLNDSSCGSRPVVPSHETKKKISLVTAPCRRSLPWFLGARFLLPSPRLLCPRPPLWSLRSRVFIGCFLWVR